MLCRSNNYFVQFHSYYQSTRYGYCQIVTLNGSCCLCIIIALRRKYRTPGCCRCLEKAKKSLPGNACVLDLYDGCTLNCVRLCPSYCGNPEQYVLGVALNRTTVWRASEVQKELLKLFLISGYTDMIFLIKMYPSQHFLTKITYTQLAANQGFNYCKTIIGLMVFALSLRILGICI